jgi:H+/Cl- antiporter ClcA
MENPLNGSGLVTAIGATIAVIAYLRNVPMKQIDEFVSSQVDNSAPNERKSHYYQAKQRACSRWILHLISQIGLMLFISLLCYRLHLAIDHSFTSQTEKGFDYYLDTTIGWTAVITSLFYLLLHLFLDIPEIQRVRRIREEVTQSLDSLGSR